ncbi:MAG: hypothetical protein EPO68_18210 [Planctomycetota bacterium]|nr:MAG: hypothetical protein EPO68_18210 [Planctomycetota bacterium]
MPHDPTSTACRAWREASFDDASFDVEGARGSTALHGHGATCAECQSWWERQRRIARALRSVARFAAPQELDRRTQPDELTEVCTRAVLDHLSVLHAPSVLDRLVREEIEGQPGTTVRRFANDLERHTAPAALDARVRQVGSAAGAAGETQAADERAGARGMERGAGRGASRARAIATPAHSARTRRAWWIAASSALAAGLLGVWTYSALDGAPRYRFEVVEIDAAQLREQSPFGFGLANGLTGGALLAQATPANGPADAEGRR